MNTTQSEYGKTQNINNQSTRANKISMLQQIEAVLNAGGETAYIKSAVYEMAITKPAFEKKDAVMLKWRMTGQERYNTMYCTISEAINEVRDSFPADCGAKLSVYENGIDIISPEIYQ